MSLRWRHFALGACGAALLGACVHAPAEPDARLVAALVDVHLLDARQAAVRDLGASDSGAPARAAVLLRHGLTAPALDVALADLARHPDSYAATLSAVSESLSTRLLVLPESTAAVMAPPRPAPRPPR